MSYFGRKEKAPSDCEKGSSGGGEGQRTGEGIISSMDTFSVFGFLTPALILVPAADGVRYCTLISYTKWYTLMIFHKYVEYKFRKHS